MSYKYPYIADKRMYARVMCACSMIRESGWFNKAVEYAADKYGVDEEKLAGHIRQRQAAGRKAKKPATPRKYHYFIRLKYDASAEGSEHIFKGAEIIKAVSKENVENRLAEFDLYVTRKQDTGSYYDSAQYHELMDVAFDTKEQAEEISNL